MHRVPRQSIVRISTQRQSGGFPFSPPKVAIKQAKQVGARYLLYFDIDLSVVTGAAWPIRTLPPRSEDAIGAEHGFDYLK